jgi:hypothetical protein
MDGGIRVRRPDGSTWEVPTEVVARNLAAYQARQATGARSAEGSPSYADAYRSALNFILQQPDMLDRWAAYNMDWDELAPHARPVEPTSSSQ